MKKILLILIFIFSINILNASDLTCFNTMSSGGFIKIKGEEYSCSGKYYLEQEKRSACFKIKEIDSGKIIKEVCDKSYFNDKYSKNERKIYKPGRKWKNSYYKSIFLELYNDEDNNGDGGNLIKYNNHILYSIFPLGYDNSQKEILDYIYSEMKIKELKNGKVGIIKYKWNIPVKKGYIEPIKIDSFNLDN